MKEDFSILQQILTMVSTVLNPIPSSRPDHFVIKEGGCISPETPMTVFRTKFFRHIFYIMNVNIFITDNLVVLF